MPTNKVITIHQSFAEMECDRSRHAASLDPVEGLRQTVELILRAYGTGRDELKLRFQKNKITFTTAL